MSDEISPDEKTPVERPDPKPKEEVGNTLAIKIAGPDEMRSNGVVVLVVLVVFGAIVAILAMLLALARRKASIARSEAAKLEEEIIRKEEEASLAENSRIQEDALMAISHLSDDLNKARGRMIDHEERHKQLMDRLTKVNSWDDLLVKGPE